MNTTIQINTETKEKIQTFGSKGDSYNVIIERLYKLAVKQQLQEFLFEEASVPIDEAIKRAKKKWQ